MPKSKLISFLRSCRFLFLIFINLVWLSSYSQVFSRKEHILLHPEILFGKTMPANDGFPETGIQKQFSLGFGRSHEKNPHQWARLLNRPVTGISAGITDFGQRDSLGIAITAMPYLEFAPFNSKRFRILTGLGASYFTAKYHPEKNPQNRAVTTRLTWAFRMFFYYQLFRTEGLTWRTSIGYSHHSNGHTRLMNQGYNSFLIGFSALLHPHTASVSGQDENYNFSQKTTHTYFSFRSGLGMNSFAEAFNVRKPVYSVAAEYGWVFQNTFKFGTGIYYRFYSHYHDYIRQEESLVQQGREYDYFRSNPVYYASNLGVSLQGEVLLNHFGIEAKLGYNLHKPAYKIDWKINEGWENAPREIDSYWQLGELNSKYRLKKRISGRLGLKFYFIGTENMPENNFYIGAHINSNLGQADFSEISLGYIYNLNFR